jgi:hypothetical protein
VIARSAILAALALAFLAPHGAARADGGAVVFVADRALRKQAGGGQPTTLATLPVDAAQVRRIETAGDGSAVLLDLAGGAAWLDLTVPRARLVLLPCRGAARLSRDGDRVACAARGGQAGFRLRPRGAARAYPGVGPTPAGFGDEAGDSLIGLRGGAVVRQRAGAPDARLADAPSAGLSISPLGDRAVGGFGDDGALYSFRLDGTATRRKLVIGTPVTWSADGAWLLVDTAEAACALRAVGGEYKCWDGFRGLALDAQGTRALVTKDGDLYRADIAGAHTKAPVLFRAGVSGPAALVP